MAKSPKVLDLSHWDSYWFPDPKSASYSTDLSTDRSTLNSVFDNGSKTEPSIFSFRSSKIDDENDAIVTQIKNSKGDLTSTMLFGDDRSIASGRDLCDDMKVLGRTAVGVVAETSFDIDALHKSGVISNSAFKELSYSYAKFMKHEEHDPGAMNGTHSTPYWLKDDEVTTEMTGLMAHSNKFSSDYRVGYDYLVAWNQDPNERTTNVNDYQNAVNDFFAAKGNGWKFDFSNLIGQTAPGKDDTHLEIDTLNFASGLLEMAAVQVQVGSILHHSGTDTGLTHDDIVKLAGFSSWQDLRNADKTAFDHAFGGAETNKDQSNPTLDIGVAEVLNHGVIETAQKILAIDEMVYQYDQTVGDTYQSIFSILAYFDNHGKLSDNIRSDNNYLPASFSNFEKGAITSDTIFWTLRNGWEHGNNPNSLSDTKGVGLNELAQLKIAHFM